MCEVLCFQTSWTIWCFTSTHTKIHHHQVQKSKTQQGVSLKCFLLGVGKICLIQLKPADDITTARRFVWFQPAVLASIYEWSSRSLQRQVRIFYICNRIFNWWIHGFSVCKKMPEWNLDLWKLEEGLSHLIRKKNIILCSLFRFSKSDFWEWEMYWWKSTQAIEKADC